MGKTYRNKITEPDEKLLELYDKLATKWARRVEASNKSKA